MSISYHALKFGRGKHRHLAPSPFRKGVSRFRGEVLMVLVSVPLLLTPAHGMAADDDMQWPEATAQLASLRTKAETCVALLKRYGNQTKIAQGKLGYADAKAEIDAVITGLTTALAESGQPDSLPSLQNRLNLGSANLQSFCDSTAKVMPPNAGHKGIVDEIAKAAIEPLIKAVSSGVATLYSNHRGDLALTRKTIQTQLEATRWLNFDRVPAAQ
jgi:hypothetical protein